MVRAKDEDLAETIGKLELRMELAAKLGALDEPLAVAELPLLDKEETRALVGLSLRALNDISQAELPRVQVGRRGVRFRPCDVVAWVRSRRVPRDSRGLAPQASAKAGR